MNLDFELHQSPLAILRLPSCEQGAFVHEYFHFIQDVSTYFGLNNMYVYAEYLHSVITNIYKQKSNKIRIPIILKNDLDNVDLNQKIAKLCTGEYSEVDTLVVTKIVENQIRMRTPQGELDITTYELISGRNKLKFGARAIMESMAFMIEQILVPKSGGAKDYPYHAAECVCNYYYPSFADDKLRLIALCDVSLLMSNPANVFINYLNRYKGSGYLPSPEEIYSDFYIEPHSFMGTICSTKDSINYFFGTMADYLSKYVAEELDPNFSIAMHRLIFLAIQKRMTNPTFIIECCREGELIYNKKFWNLLNEFGSPLIQDFKNNLSLIPPKVDPSLAQSQFSLSFIYAIEQIYNTLYDCVDCCELFYWCVGSKELVDNAPEVDERCINGPWKRCNDSYLCPYAAIWKHWGLANYRIIAKSL